MNFCDAYTSERSTKSVNPALLSRSRSRTSSGMEHDHQEGIVTRTAVEDLVARHEMILKKLELHTCTIRVEEDAFLYMNGRL